MQSFGQHFASIISRSSLGWLTSSALLLWVASSSPAVAVVPIVKEVFNGSSAYGWTVGGTLTSGIYCLTARGASLPGSIRNCGIPADDPGTGVLRLTNNTEAKQAFVFYNYAVPSDKGLVITFDYYAYGGTIDPTKPRPRGADGTTFFLFDGMTTPSLPGADGGGLGYAQRLVDGGATVNGLPNAYLGVGLDEFGNFANDYEGRGNGCPTHPPLPSPPPPGTPLYGTITAPAGSQTPNSVTIRGPGNGTTGYCFLENSGNLNSPSRPLGSRFTLDNPSDSSRTAPNTKRRVRVTLTPSGSVTVEIDPTGTGSSYQAIFTSFTAPPGRPSSFKFGFASSTGNLVNTHEIQNFTVETIETPPLPDLAITKSHAGYFSQGGTGSYTLKAQNVGNGPTYGPVAITDTLPSGFAFASATGTNWNCSAVGLQVNCVYNGPAINPGEFIPDLKLNVNVTAAPGQYTNTAVVSTGGDFNSKNDTATDRTTVVGPVVPIKSVADLNGLQDGKAKPGDILQYTITLSNNSNSIATGVKFQDAVPINTTYIPGSTQLNGTPIPDVSGTMPFVNATAVNSLGEPPGQINPNESATVTFQVKVNSPIPNSVTTIANQGTVLGDNFPPTLTDDLNTPVLGDATMMPIAIPEPRLHLVKRITSVTRGGVLLSGINFNTFVDDPNDTNDNASGWAQLSPVGVFRLGTDTPLRSNDEVEYTAYFLSDGSGPVNDVKICDLIPDGTTFVPNSIQAVIGTTSVSGNFFSPLAPLPVGNACSNQTNPNGAVIVNLGNVSNAAGSNFGFIRFHVKIN